MKNPEDIPNWGESVLSISGSDRGVHVLLIGNRLQIVKILKKAIDTDPALREIMNSLTSGKPGKDQCLEDDRRSPEREG
jgi:hypothetical protein